MMYKHLLNIVPKYICMMFQKNNAIHKHNTRKCNSLHSSVGKLETTYKSFSFHAINNYLELYVKTCPNTHIYLLNVLNV